MKRQYLLVLLVIILVINGLVFPRVQQKLTDLSGDPEVKVLDLEMGFSADQAYSFLTKIGPEGRSVYQMTELTVDVVYPLVYGTFLAGCLLFLVRRLFLDKNSWHRVAYIPFLASFFDLLENGAIVFLIARYHDRQEMTVHLASAFGLLKWVFFFFTASLILAGLLWMGVRQLKRIA